MNISILGPPGSGKGTISRMLAAESGMTIFETGAYLRAYAKQHDPALEKHLANGGMAGTSLVMRLLAEGTAQGTRSGWIIDGTPRNSEQAEEVLKLGRSGAFRLDGVVVLEAADDVVRQRLAGRRTCSGCAAIYNESIKPLPDDDKCLACGGQLVKRNDDTDQGITERIRLYRNKTEEGIGVVERGGIRVTRVNASLTAEAVFKCIIDELAAMEPKRRGITSGR
jgi:adenylate kinase